MPEYFIHSPPSPRKRLQIPWKPSREVSRALQRKALSLIYVKQNVYAIVTPAPELGQQPSADGIRNPGCRPPFSYRLARLMPVYLCVRARPSIPAPSGAFTVKNKVETQRFRHAPTSV